MCHAWNMISLGVFPRTALLLLLYLSPCPPCKRGDPSLTPGIPMAAATVIGPDWNRDGIPDQRPFSDTTQTSGKEHQLKFLWPKKTSKPSPKSAPRTATPSFHHTMCSTPFNTPNSVAPNLLAPVLHDMICILSQEIRQADHLFLGVKLRVQVPTKKLMLKKKITDCLCPQEKCSRHFGPLERNIPRQWGIGGRNQTAL